MNISAAYGPGKFGLSFELFPPKTPAGDEELFRNLKELMTFRPSYVTCTYGAGGSTQVKTLAIVERAKREFNCTVASHLTCVGSTVEQLRRYLQEADAKGVQNIVALRGDPPKGETSFTPVPGGLRYANELVTLIKQEFPHFGIAVAGYPETHQEAPSPEVDLQNLKRKVDAGADVILTQLFYDNADFERFREKCEKIKITIPIVPGILPVTNYAQIQRITTLCKAKLPANLVRALHAQGESLAGQAEIGIAHATHQIDKLIQLGIPGLHLYVLNKSEATGKILRGVKLPGR